MKLIYTLLFICVAHFSFSQEIISQELYKGELGDHEISFYLKIGESGCGPLYVDALYKYDKNKIDNWILLSSFFVEGRERYTFVEIYNTGILLLERENGKMNGMWISPDGKKQLKVILEKTTITAKEIEQLEEQLEMKWYEAKDC